MNSDKLHHLPILSKSPKKVINSENRQELQFHFENRYVTTSVHLGHLIPIYVFIPAKYGIYIDEDSQSSSFEEIICKALKIEKKLISCNESYVS